MTYHLDAYIWWCGDELCDCTQPVVVLRESPVYPSLGWQVTRLWEGSFFSEACADESLEQKAELTFAASRYHIKLDKNFSGSRSPIPTMAAMHYLREKL